MVADAEQQIEPLPPSLIPWRSIDFVYSLRQTFERIVPKKAGIADSIECAD